LGAYFARLSASDIARKIRITSCAVEMQISELKQKGLLKRIGSAKGGYWEVLNS